MRNYNIVSIFVFMMLFSAFYSPKVYSQDIRESLFSEVDSALKTANEARAQLLSPDQYEEAMDLYRDAERDLDRGRNIQNIRETLDEAIGYFMRATENTKLAEVTFAKVLAARKDALSASADQSAPERWKEAEEVFLDAARELEDGDSNDAKEEGAEAETLYRAAELHSIKSNILQSAYSLIEQAEDVDAEDNVPLTLNFAKTLINQSENELDNSRYDTDKARNLANQAQYETMHALFLNQYINELDDNDKSVEEIILTVEEPLKEIANTLLINARFDRGFDFVAQSIIDQIAVLNDSLNMQNQQIVSFEQEYITLQSENEELRSDLEKLTNEQSVISDEVKAMREFRQKFDSLNELFTNQEARIIRDKNDAILRLTGLSFDVGSSVIKPGDFGLLTKVKRAINSFPNSEVIIEGHTDSQGGDDLNMKLSQERADAVKTYLLANMDIGSHQMEAKGYGETMPLANNETEQGRSLNRRIDIRIQPVL
jgi:outer membrane protein OmpA-like peptidoglycan-associated protein